MSDSESALADDAGMTPRRYRSAERPEDKKKSAPVFAGKAGLNGQQRCLMDVDCLSE